MAMMFVSVIGLSLSIASSDMQWNCQPINFCAYIEMSLSGQTYEESHSFDCLPNGDLRKREFNNKYCSGIVTNTTITPAINLRVACGECMTYGVAEVNIYGSDIDLCTGTIIGTGLYAGPIGCDGVEGELTRCNSSQGLFHTYYANGDCTGAVVNETSDTVGKCESIGGGIYLSFSGLTCNTAAPTTALPTNTPTTNGPTQSPITRAPTAATDAPTTRTPTTATPTSNPSLEQTDSEDVDDRNDVFRMGINWSYAVVAWAALYILYS